MKVRDLMKQIERDGWKIDRMRGRHRQYRHPTKAGTVTISGHASDEVNPKTLQSALKQAGFALKYLVLFEHSNCAWSAYVPDLPGCIATGETKAETERLMREAIEFHVEDMCMHGETIPEPTTEAEYVSVPA